MHASRQEEKMMRPRLAVFVVMIVLSGTSSAALTGAPAGELQYGPYPVGFELKEAVDNSRSFPPADGPGFRGRPIRIYTWYPAAEKGSRPLTVGDFVRMAGDDFRIPNRLPVPLAKGLDEAQRGALMGKPLICARGTQAAQGEFPLLVVGQGLYYESPLSQVILCEYLASLGYVVATCPLLGTQYRLVNINVEDLETEVRDMEFVISEARGRKGVHPRSLGIVGYDLGGMAGLVLAMRNPEAGAFLSLDSGILYPHFSGLPASHPSYRESRFTIPWMHMTQARLITAYKQAKNMKSLSERKTHGDSWIVSVPTDWHGQFSSYAAFGIRREVPGFWGPIAENAEAIHDEICRLAGRFFDSVLKGDAKAANVLRKAVAGAGPDLLAIEYKKGASPSPSSARLLNAIIERGVASVRLEIDRIRLADPTARILEESEVNWLGLHFLLWWGREEESLDVFRLNADLNPGSADAYSALGEAYTTLNKYAEAIAAYKKSLELKPDQPSVKTALDDLTKKK
jgi:pimeloyl-ACP methyl ester carboxylesterase